MLYVSDMSNGIQIENFPARRLDAARDAIAVAYKRLARGAERTGQAAPFAPTITVVAERTSAVCSECGHIGGVTHIACADPMCSGVYYARRLVDLLVVAERPVLAGWEFLAVIEPLDGGNLVRQVPGARVADGELMAYRTGDAGRCDHCTTRRRRTETFVVRADGTGDTGDATTKLVGRQCLADFLGGKSVAHILAALTVEALIRATGEEGGGRDHGVTDADPIDFLSQTAACVRLDGFVSKGTAQMHDKVSTACDVVRLLTPPSPGDRGKWLAARAKYAPTETDLATAATVLEWARTLPERTDYERNLALVARQERTSYRHAGIMASAVSAWERETGEAIKRANLAAQRGASAHVGAVGDKLELSLTVEKVADVDTQFGASHYHTMRDERGNVFLWRTSSRRLPIGWAGTIRGTVKNLGEFRGEAQTELVRCVGAFPAK